MKHFLVAQFLFGALPAHLLAADVTATNKPAGPGGMTVSVFAVENMQTRNFDQLKEYSYVWLKVSGAELKQAKGTRIIVKEAVDDAGNLPQLNKPPLFAFEPVGAHLQQATMQAVQSCYLYLDRPVHGKTLKRLSGVIELAMPVRDPGSIISGSFVKEAGAPLTNAALKAAEVEITLLDLHGVPKGADDPRGWQVSYDLKDPKCQLVGHPEFFDLANRPLKSSGSGGSPRDGNRGSTTSTPWFRGPTSWTWHFDGKPPADVVAKFYLVSEKAIVTVPFEFKDLPVAPSPPR